MREKASPSDEVLGAVKLEQKGFAGLKGPKLPIPSRLPEVRLVKLGLASKKSGPFVVCHRDEETHYGSRERRGTGAPSQAASPPIYDFGVLKVIQSGILEAVQSRAARAAVGASAARGRGNTGTVVAAREFLRELDLAPFGSSPKSFAQLLDRKTDELSAALPRRARHWGLARKLMNIFLRDCFYTTYLDEVFRLRNAETHFELPLDSVTARQLKRAAGRGALPPWPGVRHLSRPLSAQFQKAAETEARRRGIARVHLDALWWSISRDADGGSPHRVGFSAVAPAENRRLARNRRRRQ